MSKTLYMLHIPKCSGMSIHPISVAAAAVGIPVFPDMSQKFSSYTDYGCVQGHFGTAPIIKSPEVETAILVRDPVDRSISNFLWFMMRRNVIGFDGYYTDEPMIDRLRHFLFTDENFKGQYNLQAKFLCTQMNDFMFEAMWAPKLDDPEWVAKRTPMGNVTWPDSVKDWYLDATDVSFELAKNTLDKAVILGTVETQPIFVQQVIDWFIGNYQIDLTDEYTLALKSRFMVERGPYINYSSFYEPHDGITYTTKMLKAMLTPAEIQQIEDNNQIDRQIYEYVKAKLS